MPRFARLAAVVGALILASALRAEVPNKSLEKLKKHSDVIATGKVVAIYTRKVNDGKWNYTHYLAVIATPVVEGKPGKLVHVRYWRRAWVGGGMPPPSTSGHRGLPKEGQHVTAYLKKQADGSLHVLLPNGIQHAIKAPVKAPVKK